MNMAEPSLKCRVLIAALALAWLKQRDINATEASGEIIRVNNTSVNRVVTIQAKPEPLTIDTTTTAMIVVDMQNDFCTKGGMFDRAGIDISGARAALKSTARLLASARQAGLPIIYLKMGFRPDLSDFGPPNAPNPIKHLPLAVGRAIQAPDGRKSRILIRDTWNTDVVAELEPQVNDTVIYKTRYSGFYETELDTVLRSRGVKSLIVVGVSTSVCVESTLRDAMYRDYRCILVSDCTAEPMGRDLPRTNYDASLLVIQIVFGWVAASAEVVQALEAQRA
jgi:ureidoacrylate peracid hydrolase